MRKKPSPEPEQKKVVSLFGGEELTHTELPNLMEDFMKSKQSLLTLTDMSAEEINVFNACSSYAERYDHALRDDKNNNFAKDFLERYLLMKISKNRMGRREFLAILKALPSYQRQVNAMEPQDENRKMIKV
jgi:hypothetical protein